MKLRRADEASGVSAQPLLRRATTLQYQVLPGARFEAGHRGLPEPSPNCERVPAASVDWVLVPGIAFDPSGGRLGYGGGYYDRLLPVLPARAARVAGAFSAQIVDAVPSAPHDITMDTVVTEAGVVVDRPRAR